MVGWLACCAINHGQQRREATVGVWITLVRPKQRPRRRTFLHAQPVEKVLAGQLASRREIQAMFTT